MTGKGFVAAILLGLGAISGLVRADFVPPADGPVPFRRDRLPLDVDRLRDLSRQVLELGGATRRVSPVDQRDFAKILAVAVAIDPGNRTARQIIDQPAEISGFIGNSDQAVAAASSIRETLRWLSDSQAGADANALAECLNDLLAPKDEDLPESGRWNGWIPELASYERKAPAPAAPGTPPAEKTVPEPKKVEIVPTPLAAAGILVPLRVNGGKVEVIPLEMAGSSGHSEERAIFHLEGDKEKRAAAYDTVVKTALAKRQAALPAGLQIDLTLGKNGGPDLRSNGATLGGAAAVLLDAALSGAAPAKTIALAAIDDHGKLVLPPNFWDVLRGLPAEPGVRVVVPKAGTDYLSSLLTLDGPALFLAHEVVLADSVADLCDLCQPPKGDAADTVARFQEVQRAGAGKALGTFLATPAVVQRLEQIAESMPENASARLLALQGSGNRPRYLPRTVFAREVRRALQPLDYLRETEVTQVEIKKVDTLHEKVREDLEKLLPNADPRDRDIYKEAISTADTLRTLSRALKISDSARYYEATTRRSEAHSAALVSYREILGKLNELIGDQAAETPRFPAR